ncbi:MAG: BON domain-containing protein [Acidobacteria bacterium]|nr:BON domain-containing protein [Acidobacteriota bacterium]
MTSLSHRVASDPDERILCDTMRQIVWQFDIDAHKLRVAVRNGCVRLLGKVETCLEKTEAGNAARAVFGVTEVINDLEVAPNHFRDDRDLMLDIVAALGNSTGVLEEMPQVSVHDGVAVLSGRSRWEFQRFCAERTALSIAGVKRVVNLISVDTVAETQPANRVPALTITRKAS